MPTRLGTVGPSAIPILGRPITRVGLVAHHDGSTHVRGRLPGAPGHLWLATHSHLLPGFAGRVPAAPGFVPASRIEDQSLPWGTRVSPFTAAVGNRAPHRASSCPGRGTALAPHPLVVTRLPVSRERIAAKQSRRTVPTQRSATAFARGARTGLRSRRQNRRIGSGPIRKAEQRSVEGIWQRACGGDYVAGIEERFAQWLVGMPERS